jgi:hypothetical protein
LTSGSDLDQVASLEVSMILRSAVALILMSAAIALRISAQERAAVPAIDASEPNLSLEVAGDDPCQVDFRNIRMFGENEEWTARFKNGKFKKEFRTGYYEASIEGVHCFRDPDKTKRRAVVITHWIDCGGSCTKIGVVQVFAVRLGHPTINQQFSFDSHAVRTGAKFSEKTGILTIVGRSNDGSANCCPEFFDVVTYQWQGNKFVQQSYRRVPASTSTEQN